MEGPWRSFGGPEGSGRSGVDRRGPGGDRQVPRRFWRGPGKPLETIIFFLGGSEFVNVLIKY